MIQSGNMKMEEVKKNETSDYVVNLKWIWLYYVMEFKIRV